MLGDCIAKPTITYTVPYTESYTEPPRELVIHLEPVQESHMTNTPTTGPVQIFVLMSKF